jgi:DNA-directed RNA polymerase specialized sigma24 family protein
MTEPLARVKQAAAERGRAEEAYRAAVLSAYVAGLSYAQIAKAAGVSRQAVRQLVERSQ